MLNLVYISVNFQATGSVEISLDFSLNTIPRVSISFSTIMGSKVMKANVKIAGNLGCQDLL